MFVSLACGVVKADYRKIVSFFLEHLQAALRNEAFDQKQIDFILGLHTNVGIGKTKNRSAVGALNDRIDDTRTILAVNGGFANCKCGEINTALNETPMKPVHFSNGLAEMAAFLEREMK
jgi:hypothetical protein